MTYGIEPHRLKKVAVYFHLKIQIPQSSLGYYHFLRSMLKTNG